jgi:periplasmic mercuric ion binding protein
MNISKSFVSIALTTLFFVGCKDTASKSPTDNAVTDTASEKKEILAAVKPETVTFHIEGMSCAMGCAKTIEKKLAETNGVQKATVDFDKKEAIVAFDATIQTPEKLTQLVEAVADGKTYKVSEMKVKG